MTGAAIGEAIREQREAILRVAAKHGATEIWLIGPVARGDARPDSDVDLLVAWQQVTSRVSSTRRLSSWNSRACWAEKSI